MSTTAPAESVPQTVVELLPTVAKLYSTQDNTVLNDHEIFSSLTVLRRAATLNDAVILQSQPPVLLPQCLVPERMFLHKGDHTQAYQHTPSDLNSIGELGVVGAAMMQTRRGAHPTVLLFSKSAKALVAHVASANFAVLELEWHDDAYSSRRKWEEFVQGTLAGEVTAARKEAAAENRTCDLPDAIKLGRVHHLGRGGPFAFLALRSCRDKVEYDCVTTHLKQMLTVVPPATASLMEQSRDVKNIQLMACFESSVPKLPEGVRVRSAMDSAVAHATDLATAPCLAAVADILYYLADDDAQTLHGERQALYGTRTKRTQAHAEQMKLINSAERRGNINRAKIPPDNSLAKYVQQENSYTLQNAMRDLSRSYKMELIVDGTQLSTSDVIKVVVKDLIVESDRVHAMAACVKADCNQLTVLSGLKLLGALLEKGQSLLLMDRKEFEFEDVVLVSATQTVARIPKQALARLLTNPRVTPLVVDQRRVQRVHVREPEETRTQPPFLRKMLELSEQVRPNASASGACDARLAAIEATLASLQQTLSTDWTRKIDYLVEEKALTPTSSVESTTMRNLKRARKLLEAYDARFSPKQARHAR